MINYWKNNKMVKITSSFFLSLKNVSFIYMIGIETFKLFVLITY